MEVSGIPDVPNAVTLTSDLSLPFGGGTHNRPACPGEDKNVLPLLECR